MYKIAICDDHRSTVEYVSSFIKKEFGDQHKIFEFVTPKELERYVNVVLKGDLDILVIDVDLVTDNGIKVTERLKKSYPGIRVIFISGQIRFVGDIFELKPVYFIEKPIDGTKLLSAIHLAIQDIEEGARDTISILNKGVVLNLDLRKIMYIESCQRTVTIYEGKNKRDVNTKMDVIEKLLPEKFCRCHQSFIVNFDYVRELTMFKFILFSGAKIPVSQSKHREVKHLFTRFLGESI